MQARAYNMPEGSTRPEARPGTGVLYLLAVAAPRRVELDEDVFGLVKHHVLEVATGDHLVHPSHEGEKVQGKIRGG